MSEFKFRKLIKAELESGLLCQHILPSRVACGRIAKRMVWEPVAPDTAQPFCEAHCMVEIARFRGLNEPTNSVIDLDSVGTPDDETSNGTDTTPEAEAAVLTPTENVEKATDTPADNSEPKKWAPVPKAEVQ